MWRANEFRRSSALPGRRISATAPKVPFVADGSRLLPPPASRPIVAVLLPSPLVDVRIAGRSATCSHKVEPSPAADACPAEGSHDSTEAPAADAHPAHRIRGCAARAAKARPPDVLLLPARRGLARVRPSSLGVSPLFSGRATRPSRITRSTFRTWRRPAGSRPSSIVATAAGGFSLPTLHGPSGDETPSALTVALFGASPVHLVPVRPTTNGPTPNASWSRVRLTCRRAALFQGTPTHAARGRGVPPLHCRRVPREHLRRDDRPAAPCTAAISVLEPCPAIGATSPRRPGGAQSPGTRTQPDH